MNCLRKRVRSPVVGGIFYPDEKIEVLNHIRSYGLRRGRGGYARVIIAPHGAWEISGSLAAAVFATAAGRIGEESPSQVVVLGPIHDKRQKGLFLSDSHFFQTPLGSIRVDEELSGEIGSCSSLFETNDIPHLQEHSIEVLLPFIKYCFPRARIVPILMGQPREAVISALAGALKLVVEPVIENTLLVISFNLMAYSGEGSGCGKAQECMRLCIDKDADSFSSALLNGWIDTCGGGLVASLLQSGLVASMRPIPQPLIRVPGETCTSMFYGGLSFE